MKTRLWLICSPLFFTFFALAAGEVQSGSDDDGVPYPIIQHDRERPAFGGRIFFHSESNLYKKEEQEGSTPFYYYDYLAEDEDPKKLAPAIMNLAVKQDKNTFITKYILDDGTLKRDKYNLFICFKDDSCRLLESAPISNWFDSVITVKFDGKNRDIYPQKLDALGFFIGYDTVYRIHILDHSGMVNTKAPEQMKNDPSADDRTPGQRLVCIKKNHRVIYSLFNYEYPYPSCQRDPEINCLCELEKEQSWKPKAVYYATYNARFCGDLFKLAQSGGVMPLSQNTEIVLPDLVSEGYTCSETSIFKVN